VRRSWTNLFIDLLIAGTMLSVAVTGIVLRYALPPGSGRRHGRGGLAFWGWSRHEWCDIHFWCATAVMGLLLLHVALHWNWLRSMCQRLRPSHNAVADARSAIIDTQT
jgi:hypothetical protein